MPQDNSNNKEKNGSFQDVIPPTSRRSVRDIPIPEGRRKVRLEPEVVPSLKYEPIVEEVVDTEEEHQPLYSEHDETFEEEEKPAYIPQVKRKPLSNYSNIPDGHFSKMKSHNFSKTIMVFVGVLALGGIAFGIFSTAGDAHLKITPRQEKLSIDASFNAKKSPEATELGYEIITLSKESTQTAEATGEEDVVRKATGTVIIYNNFSTAEQKLVATTRLQTSSGLVYRIPDPITVPGQQTVNGKLIPGSVETKVWADEAGDKYNAQSADFTIPGFKGDPRFEKFYAKTKGPIADGFVGKERKVAQTTLDEIKGKLQSKIKEELVRDIRAQVPGNFIIYETGTITTFESLPNKSGAGNSVEVVEKGTLSAIAFDRQKLSETVAKAKGGIEGASFAGIENLGFDLFGKETFNPSNTAEISFKLKGDGQLVWGYDKQKLIQNLIGTNKKDVGTVLAKYPTIEKAEAILKPFWTRSFPKTVDKITIEDIIDNN